MICPKCYGVGRIPFGEEPEIFSEEEWLRQCTTEELAEFIRKQRDDWSDGWYSDWHPFSEIVEWLKQPHREE